MKSTTAVRKKSLRKASRTKNTTRMLSPSQVVAAVKTMSEPTGTARFGAGKALSVTAEKEPGRVYPHFREIAALLESESKIVRWNAMQILPLLAPVDTRRRLDTFVDTYLALIRGSNLVSAANAIRGLGLIALSRSDLVDRIVSGILAVERATYETPECRNVAIGQALDAFRQLGSGVCGRADVAAFVGRQRSNSRAAVARRAARMAASLS